MVKNETKYSLPLVYTGLACLENGCRIHCTLMRSCFLGADTHKQVITYMNGVWETRDNFLLGVAVLCLVGPWLPSPGGWEAPPSPPSLLVPIKKCLLRSPKPPLGGSTTPCCDHVSAVCSHSTYSVCVPGTVTGRGRGGEGWAHKRIRCGSQPQGRMDSPLIRGARFSQ